MLEFGEPHADDLDVSGTPHGQNRRVVPESEKRNENVIA